MRLKIKDEESVLNIDRSVLYDLYKRFPQLKNQYHPVSAIQSDQDYITPPSSTEGYVPKTYEDSVPDNFAVEKEYSEVYQPQVEQFITKVIQMAPMLQSLLEQSSDESYNRELAGAVLEFLLERNQEADGTDNTMQDDMSDPTSDPGLAGLVAEVMPEDPDMDQMPESPMSLDSLVESAMEEAMPDQMPEMPDPQEPEQEMTLEMLINLLFGG